MERIQGLTHKYFNKDIGNHRNIRDTLKRHGLHGDELTQVQEHLFSERIPDRHLSDLMGREGIHSGNIDQIMRRLKESPDFKMDERSMRGLEAGLRDRIHAVVVPKEI